MFVRTGSLGGARFAVTDRSGGVSARPYDSFNLSERVGDSAAAVRENRSRLAAAVGLQPGRLRFMDQVHGASVAEVSGASDGPPPEADALVTTEPGLGLAVMVADCTPVLLVGRRSPVIGVAHAGRPGLVAGVVPALVAAMRSRGVRADRIVAYLGPAICGGCYEVPAQMQEEVCAVVPAARATTRHGTPAVDVRAGIVAQLLSAGVEAIQTESWCTAERSDLFSFRRDRVTGRLAAVLWAPA